MTPRDRSRLIAGIITTATLIIGGLVLASRADAAAVAPSAGTSQATAVTVTPGEREAAAAAVAQIQKFESALTTVGGVYRFNAASAIALGGSRATVDQVAVAVDAAGGVTTGITVPVSAVAATENAAAAVIKHCYGSSNYSRQWFGLQVKVNSCTVAQIISDIHIGAGVTSIVSAILLAVPGVGTVVSVLGGVAASLLAIGAGILGNCSADGDGTIIDLSGSVAWCANQ